jgi:hypothetical protein
MTIWHIRLFVNGTEHNEDRGDLDSAKEWVRLRLEALGHAATLDWKLVGTDWRAGFRPDLNAYVTPRS